MVIIINKTKKIKCESDFVFFLIFINTILPTD